jgi:myo-inositol-1(or 4)-monophosphatase
MNSDSSLLQSAIREAGAMALSVLKQGVTVWSKPDGSVLTDGDLVIDEFLRSTLTKAQPDYGWLSEESPDDLAANQKRLASRRTWIVDPIDGTRSYANKGSSWCIGACLVENGRPLLSCVFHPQLGRFYFAERFVGCFLNDQKLTLEPQGETLKQMRVMGTKSLVSKLERNGATNMRPLRHARIW